MKKLWLNGRVVLLLTAYLLLGTAQSYLTFFGLIHQAELSNNATYWVAIKSGLYYTFNGYSNYIYRHYLSFVDIFWDYLFFLFLFSFLLFILRQRKWLGTFITAIFCMTLMLFVNLSIFVDHVAKWSTYSFAEAFRESLSYGVIYLWIAVLTIVGIDVWWRRGRLKSQD